MRLHSPVLALLVSVLLLASCAYTPPGASPGSKLAGVETIRYTGVLRPPDRASEMQVVRKIISTREQRAVATARAKSFVASLNKWDFEYIRQLGVTHICVAVPRGGKHQGEASVMMWDTQTESFVGNEVFEVNNLPPNFSILQMPDYVALCVLRYGA